MILKKYFKKNKFKRKRYTGNIYPAYQHHQSGAISISTHIYVLHISIWTDPTLLSTSDLEVWLVFKRWKQVPQSIVWRVLRTNLISLCCINRLDLQPWLYVNLILFLDTRDLILFCEKVWPTCMFELWKIWNANFIIVIYWKPWNMKWVC